jgi:predicted RecB family nuclease
MVYALCMNITPPLFEAFLKCPTKCWLRANSEPPSGNTYAEWVQAQNESFRATQTERLVGETPPDEFARAPSMENLKTSRWRLAVDVPVQISVTPPPRNRPQEVQSSSPTASQPTNPSPATSPATNQESVSPGIFMVQTRLQAVERVPSEGRGKAAQFIPIRFVFFNKLSKDDKLQLAFDAFVLSAAMEREVSGGKSIHGDNHATLKVKTSALAGEVRKRMEKITTLLTSPAPPDHVLNRHCPECEFHASCRQKALEKDDLSLLSGMSEKERKALRSKGIFTITQLSYTFRPRHRPKHLRDKREKYHHSLKALAIREKKIHIVGSPELKIEGTPVYLDVEALPDRDFYYLVGLRIGNGETAVQHSLWADAIEDEGKIWQEFLAILATVEKPVLIHYGSYETTFLKRMSAKFSIPADDPAALVQPLKSSINLLSTIFAQIYLPTVSNGLKQIAEFLGFRWSTLDVAGPQSVVWRHAWEGARDPLIKAKLVTYNAEDCSALALVERTIARLTATHTNGQNTQPATAEVVRCDDLKPPFSGKWRTFSSPVTALELINKAAHWKYQRDRIYMRSTTHPRRPRRENTPHDARIWRIDTVITPSASSICPICHHNGSCYGPPRLKTVQDIVFGRFSLKRRVIQHRYQPYWCSRCKRRFGFAQDFPKGKRPGRCKYGRNLLAFLFYQILELAIPQRTVIDSLDRLFGLKLNPGSVASFKEKVAADYTGTAQLILERIVAGPLAHVDETHITIKRTRAYVWVFTSLREVAYVYSDSREGELVQAKLKDFKGVLVSDFYAIYDSINCPQQRCLIHLVRDLNEALLKAPYDEELKSLVTDFGQVLRPIIEEVDRRGLKKRFLRKHLRTVDRFYRNIGRLQYTSPVALACRDRFEKNRHQLFTFLNYDDVPWNNNNAEHAIKAFARLREFIETGATEKGIREYLILLSICQSCKYMGVDFLDFLRSGEKDIHAFAEKRRGHKRRLPKSEPPALPT